jgi:mannose-1-phosphate guanylyltransferase
MQALLLAAGYGTRLRPYTTLRPKPLLPMLNRPLLLRSLAQLRALRCAPILVNCHHLAHLIEAALAPWPELLIQHETEILGTGGSLRRALGRLHNEPLLVVNGDLYHEIDLALLYQQHLASGNQVTLALHDYPRFNKVGLDGDRVRSFDVSSDDKDERLAFTGIHVVNPDALERIPPAGFFHIIDLYRELADENKVGFVRVDGARWHDIGTPEDYLSLHQELLSANMDEQISATAGWLIAPSAQLATDVILDDWGCIGPGAVIGSGLRLCRSVVWDGVELHQGGSYSDSIVTGIATIDAQNIYQRRKA